MWIANQGLGTSDEKDLRKAGSRKAAEAFQHRRDPGLNGVVSRSAIPDVAKAVADSSGLAGIEYYASGGRPGSLAVLSLSRRLRWTSRPRVNCRDG